MNITVLAPPAAEPLTLSEAKAYLRIGYAGEDALVAELLASARARIEAELNLALIQRSLRVTYDMWPKQLLSSGAMRLPVRPAASLSAVRVFDRDGEAETVTSRFALTSGRQARLALTGAMPWPGRTHAGVEIDYVAGFGADAGDVADDLRLAVQRLLQHAYRSRESLSEPLPEDVAALLAPWRRVRL